MWGRRRKARPKEYFIFGTIQEEDRVIRINPLLDQPFVPLWFLQYVLYHEMLHSVVPDETNRPADGAFTPKNSTGANEISRVTGGRAVGKKKISRVFCAERSDVHFRLRRTVRRCRRSIASDSEGVVATFFLMRYQRVVASRREINFARQLFRISFFISALQENFANDACRNVSGVKLRSIRRRWQIEMPPVSSETTTAIASDSSVIPRARAMAQTEAAIERFPLADRENAGGRGNAPVAHDHSAIMQGGFRMKKRQEKLDRKN